MTERITQPDRPRDRGVRLRAARRGLARARSGAGAARDVHRAAAQAEVDQPAGAGRRSRSRTPAASGEFTLALRLPKVLRATSGSRRCATGSARRHRRRAGDRTRPRPRAPERRARPPTSRTAGVDRGTPAAPTARRSWCPRHERRTAAPPTPAPRQPRRPADPRLRRAVGVAGRRTARRPCRRRARRGPRVRGRAPQPPHHPRQDRAARVPSVTLPARHRLVALMEAARHGNRRPTSTGWSSSRSSSATSFARCAAGALWEVRESRVQPDRRRRSRRCSTAQRCRRARRARSTTSSSATARSSSRRSSDGRRLAVIGDLYVEPEARAVGVGEALATDLVDAGRRGRLLRDRRVRASRSPVRRRTSSNGPGSPPAR